MLPHTRVFARSGTSRDLISMLIGDPVICVPLILTCTWTVPRAVPTNCSVADPATPESTTVPVAVAPFPDEMLGASTSEAKDGVTR